MLPVRPCGKQGLQVSAQGLGCMGMSAFYGGYEDPAAKEEFTKVFDKAAELGCTMLDTADLYGPFTNEQLIGKEIEGRRDKFVIATKCGVKVTDAGFQLDASPAFIRESCEGSLKRLGVDSLDLYYYNRRDPKTPIEDTINTLKELVNEGKVKYIGLSEISPADVRKAHAIHPISAIQLEWSVFTRDAEAELIPLCRELGIGIVAYSPLGRGLLTGAIKSVDDVPLEDFRRHQPRFAEHIEENLKLVKVIEEMAAKKGCTPGQVAIAWLHAQGDDVFPIPGTKRVSRLEENVGAFNIHLSEKELMELGAIGDRVKGTRYDEGQMKITFAYT